MRRSKIQHDKRPALSANFWANEMGSAAIGARIREKICTDAIGERAPRALAHENGNGRPELHGPRGGQAGADVPWWQAAWSTATFRLLILSLNQRDGAAPTGYDIDSGNRDAAHGDLESRVGRHVSALEIIQDLAGPKCAPRRKEDVPHQRLTARA